MPEIPGANLGDSVPPAVSPPANNTPETPPVVTPPEAINPETVVPYHEREDLKAQAEYVARMAMNRIKEQMAPPAQPTEPPADYRAQIEKIAEKLALKHKIDKDIAMDVLLENRQLVDAELNGMKEKMAAIDLTFRFGGLFSQVPDAGQYAPEMKEIFNTLQPIEREFVMKSPKGAKFLYDEAKLLKAAQAPNPARFSGTAPATRSASPAVKMGTQDQQMNAALEAFKKGDQQAYKNAVKSLG